MLIIKAIDQIKFNLVLLLAMIALSVLSASSLAEEGGGHYQLHGDVIPIDSTID